MRPVLPIATIIHGSHLYGTSTPSSDRDYKGVHVASGRGILLQRPEHVIDTSEQVKDARGKNTGESVDRQSYEIAKFCRMIADGDKIATEILFAPDWAIVESHATWWNIRQEARGLINRQTRGFVSYCRQQAAKYGIKGSRMGALRDLLDLIDAGIERTSDKARMDTIEDQLRELAEKQEQITLEMIEGGNAPMLHVVCCDRKIGMRLQLGEARRIYGRVWDGYGQRARAALGNEGIDWKAISHAVRVARQARELLETGEITFPRPDAEELLAIKLGRFDYKAIEPMLEDLVASLSNVESKLPEETDERLIEEIVLPRYLRQI